MHLPLKLVILPFMAFRGSDWFWQIDRPNSKGSEQHFWLEHHMCSRTYASMEATVQREMNGRKQLNTIVGSFCAEQPTEIPGRALQELNISPHACDMLTKPMPT